MQTLPNVLVIAKFLLFAHFPYVCYSNSLSISAQTQGMVLAYRFSELIPQSHVCISFLLCSQQLILWFHAHHWILSRTRRFVNSVSDEYVRDKVAFT